MLHFLDSLFPVRYSVFGLSALGLALSLFSLVVFGVGFPAFLVCGALVWIGVYDIRHIPEAVGEGLVAVAPSLDHGVGLVGRRARQALAHLVLALDP